MKTKFAALSALALLCAASAEAETYTTLFCDDSSDGSTAAANIAAGGWTMTGSTSTSPMTEGTLSNPTKFNKNFHATSPTWGDEEFVTNVIIGARVSNLARTAVVKTVAAGGAETTTEKALGGTGSLQEVSFEFDAEDQIVSIDISFTTSGTTTAYLYYVTVNTGAYDSGLTTLDTPIVTATPEMDGLWLSWTADPHAYDYELQVLDPDGEQAGTWSFNQEQSASQWNGVHVEGLAEETEYTVRLRVLGDGTTYANSSWFEDTFSTIADPWRPEWTISEPTPAAPIVGTPIFFSVSATRYVDVPGDNPYYDPQTVAFDGLTPAVAGTQPAFANGVFSWTPGMDDDGNYIAAFSVQNDGGTYSTNVAFTVRGTMENREIFFEGFSGCSGTWAGQRFLDAEDDVPVARTDIDTWRGKSLYNAPSAMRFGNGSNHGWIVSPLIVLANDAASATVTVSFDACALQSTSTTIKFSVLDANGNAIAGFAEQTVTLPVLSLSGDQTTLAQGLADANESAQSFTFTAPGSFRLTFDASSNGNSNVAIDSVKVTQKVSTSLVDLDVPTGLAVVDGTLSTNTFSVAWNAVANASS